MVFIYGYTGTTSLAGIAEQIGQLLDSGDLSSQAAFGDSKALLFGIVLVIAGFGFKISSVPFQFLGAGRVRGRADASHRVPLRRV